MKLLQGLHGVGMLLWTKVCCCVSSMLCWMVAWDSGRVLGGSPLPGAGACSGVTEPFHCAYEQLLGAHLQHWLSVP